MPVKIIPPTPSAYTYPLLIKHLLHAPMTRAPDQEIVYRDLRRRTYREFRERIGRLASGLTQIGVDQGDVVAILEWDTDRYHECYFAIPMMGAVMQTVNVSLVPEDIAYTIIDSGATTVLFNADFLPLVEKLAPHLKAVRNYVLMHDRSQAPPTDFAIKAEYEALLSISSPYFPFPDFDENAAATIFHTTGTTGRPKGVYFSHRQMVLHTLTGLVEYGLPPGHGRFHRDDVYMPMTPMFHVHAWGCPYTATLSGCKLVFPGRYSPEIFVKMIDKEKVTFTHCVPTLLQMLLTAPGVEKIDLSHLKMVVGGAALPPALARAAMARGMDVFSGYGQSEFGPMLTGAHIKSKHVRPEFEDELPYRTSSGIAAPMVDLRVVDENMAEVPHDGKAIGEIVVRAPVAHHRLSQQPRGLGSSVGRRLHAHRRRRLDRPGRLYPDRRPAEGHRQERRRVDLLDHARKHHHGAAGGPARRGHSDEGRQMGREAVRARHPRSGLHRQGR